MAVMMVSKERVANSIFGKIKNKALKLTDLAKLTQHMKLHLLCEGYTINNKSKCFIPILFLFQSSLDGRMVHAVMFTTVMALMFLVPY